MLVCTRSLLLRFARLVVLLSGLMVCSRASADDSWHAPSGCPDRAFAETRLRALHVDPALLQEEHASVWFDVSATGEQRARVRLRHRERVEQRVLYDRECAALAEAALIVISLSFEDERAEPADAPSAPARAHSLVLSPLARLDVGSLPSATLGLGGALGMRLGRVYGELEGSYFLSRDGEREDRRARGRFGLATGAARVCYALTERWLSACTALELGRANGRALGAARSEEARGLWAAALLGLAVRVPTEHVSPALFLELGLPFQRPSFDVQRAGPVFQAERTILRLSLQMSFEVHWRR